MKREPSHPGNSKPKHRKSSKVNYLSWAVQAKLKRQRVDEMMIKRAYYSDKNKGVTGTGVNEGAQDSGWSMKRRKDGDEDGGGRTNDEIEAIVEQGGALALGADRKPMKIPAPQVERTRLPKERPKKALVIAEPVEDPPSSSTSHAKSVQTSDSRKNLDISGAARKSPPLDVESDGPRFRDLKRAAYARSSLHTFKSRPSQDSKGRATSRSRRPGRGQPNMKLRMDVMLEQIRRSGSM